MAKISVIVPVYNTEKYIKKCIESIINQTYKDIEIIIVNDGSEDSSEKIIESYIDKNVNIIYLKKENGGLSDARNYGLKRATGDYICFVDSDDYLDNHTIEKLKPYIEKNIDLIKFKLQKVNEEGKVLEKIEGPIFEETTGEEAFNKMYCKDILIDSPCVYLIKKELLTKNNLKFQGIYHEDFGLIPFVILSAKSAVSTPYYLYQYVQSSNSITRNEDYTKTMKKMDSVLEHYDNMIKRIETMKLNNKTKENVKIYYTN